MSAAALLALLTVAARAALPPDVGRAPEVATLALPPSKHWVWVNDFVFPHMSDGTAILIDGDTGRVLGSLSTGHSFVRVLLPKAGNVIYSPETYFSRGSRGVRTDIVTVYDAATLAPLTEIPIPPKRSSNVPMMANAALTDDDRYLLVYNFTPAQSLSIVDLSVRRFLHELPTPGCALVYPAGPRTLFSVCGDGALLWIELTGSGSARTTRTEPLLPMREDPVSEKAARLEGTWYFATFDGEIHPLSTSGARPVALEPWPLGSLEERRAGWRPGGLQELAVDASRHALYALMHQGDRSTHKDPGREWWVFDLATHRRTARFPLKRESLSLALSSDGALLYALASDARAVDIYDPASGALLRSVEEIGTTPTLLVTP